MGGDRRYTRSNSGWPSGGDDSSPDRIGQTLIASEIIKSAISKSKSVLFIAHRHELIRQCADKLEAFGIKDYGIIMNGFTVNIPAHVQVASIQTLIKREYPLRPT